MDNTSDAAPKRAFDVPQRMRLPGSVRDLAETLVALANGQGGTLLLHLDGLSREDALDRVREAALRSDPILILPPPQSITEGDDEIAGEQDNEQDGERYGETLSVTVPRGLPRVFSIEGRYLARDGQQNRPLGSRELRRLLIERGDLNYEEEIAAGATLDDLDRASIDAYAATIRVGRESSHEVLLRRGCLVQRDGKLTPTNAGLLLFGKEPQRFIRSAAITAVRFAGIAMGDVFTRQDISGNLPDQIRRAETFLLDNLRKGVQMRASMERAEQLEYPMAAVRELVVNAVSHRDYSIAGDDIRLFIFADRLEVTSPGRLPGPVTIANIAEERFSRNPIIVQVLADMGFIERLGYGVDRVITLMQTYGLPAPEFIETAGGFRVYLRSAGLLLPDAIPAVALTPRQDSALHYLSQHSRLTNKDLQELFPEVHPETIRRDLADLVSKGLLFKFGQKRGSYYVLPTKAE